MKSLTVVGFIALAGCAAAEQNSVTWDEFVGLAKQEPDTGIYIVDGDEPVDSLEALRAYYDRWVALRSIAETDIGSVAEPLIVNRVNGADDKWSATAAI